MAQSLAALAASASLAAPVTLSSTVLVEPSASSAICSARSPQARVTAAASAWCGTGPARPLASSSTVSLVDWAPSTVSRLKLPATAARRMSCNSAGSAAASVVSTASIVAMFGSSIAAPLAMPPTVKPPPSTVTSLGTVSVVIMALAASPPPRACRAATTRGMPAAMTSIGNSKPIRPVEHTSTWSLSQPSDSALSAHMRWASASPCCPVAALALPLLRMTATASPPERSR